MKKLLTLALMASAVVAADKMPLPAKVLGAKTVALVNGLASENGVLDGVYRELKKWGRWQVVDVDQSPDIVLVLSGSDSFLGQTTNAQVHGAGTWATGTSTTMPMAISMKRFLLVIDPITRQQLFSVSCERRIGAGYTGGVLVNELKKRTPK